MADRTTEVTLTPRDNASDNPNAPGRKTPIETGVASQRTLSTEAGSGTVTETNRAAITQEFADEEERKLLEDGTPPSPEGEGEDAGDEAGDEGGDDGAADAPLPEFDADKPEVVEAYDKKYLTGENQQLNRETIGKEFWDAYSKVPEAERKDHGYMPEGFYKWAEQTFQVDRSFITEYEQGLVAKSAQEQASFYGSVDGGKPALDAAIGWAREGGYSEEARARFNAAIQRGGEDRADAVEALMSRFRKAGGKVPQTQEARQQRGPGRRRSSPQRDATGGAGAGTGQGGGGNDRFANQGDYTTAWEKALADVRDARRAGDPKGIRKAEQARDAVRVKGRRGFSGGR